MEEVEERVLINLFNNCSLFTTFLVFLLFLNSLFGDIFVFFPSDLSAFTFNCLFFSNIYPNGFSHNSFFEMFVFFEHEFESPLVFFVILVLGLFNPEFLKVFQYFDIMFFDFSLQNVGILEHFEPVLLDTRSISLVLFQLSIINVELSGIFDFIVIDASVASSDLLLLFDQWSNQCFILRLDSIKFTFLFIFQLLQLIENIVDSYQLDFLVDICYFLNSFLHVSL